MEYGKKSANTYQEKEVHNFYHQKQFKLSSSVKTRKKKVEVNKMKE